jgi:hypothetical protein
MRELLDLGFRAVIVAVRDGVLPPSLLGKTIDEEMLRHFASAGVDLAGENGEFHTFVVDGPPFTHPVEVDVGEESLRDGVWFVDLSPRDPPPGQRPADEGVLRDVLPLLAVVEQEVGAKATDVPTPKMDPPRKGGSKRW